MNRSRYYNTSRSGSMPFALDGIVTENMRDKARSYKRLSRITMAGIFVCFVLFGVTGFTMGEIGGGGFMLILIPFFGFGACGVLTGIYNAKFSAAQLAVGLMDQVEMSDWILIKNLSMGGHLDAEKLLMLKRLITKGNLPDYEIVGDMLVAKKHLRMSVEDAYRYSGEEITVVEAPESANCPVCGAIKGEGKFCEYCGARLR